MQSIPFIGKIIKEELKKQGRSVVWLANKLNTNRMACYRIFNSNSIDTLVLLRISSLLNVDFFAIYTKLLQEGDEE